jgi:hypothetical protein
MMSVCNVVLCLGRLLGLLQGRAVSSWRREPGASGQWPVSQRPVRLQLQAENDGGRHPGGGRAAPFALAYARPGRDEPNRGRGTKSCRYRTPCGADAENISGSLCGRIRGLGHSSLTGHRLRSGRISRAGPPTNPTTLTSLPHLTVLTSPRSHTHTPPPPLTTSHPGRSNRQTAPRGTGEGFRLCRKPTSHPIPPSTAFVHPLLLIKKIFSAPWMFPLLGRTQPRRPIESARKVRDGHPGSADTRRPPPQQNTTLMTGFNRVVFFSSV